MSYGKIEVEAPEDIRKRGFSYDSFLYQTLYDGLKNWSESISIGTSDAYFSGYAQIFRMSFPVLIRSKNPEFHNLVKNHCNILNAKANNLQSNFGNRLSFFIECQKFLHCITDELKKTRFVPPEKTSKIAGSGSINEVSRENGNNA